MDLRRITRALIALASLLLVIACGEAGSPDQPTVTQTPSATNTGLVSATPELLAGNRETPIAGSSQPTATPHPDIVEPTQQYVAPVANSQREVATAVFYDQYGITLEYYWPLDARSNLSAEETEILAYNSTDGPIEFRSPVIAFVENGIVRSQTSGTWEKFPTLASWDRIEYLQIPPSSYGGEPLLADAGEKIKLHWHMDGVASPDTAQTVTLELTVVMDGREIEINETLVRGGGESASAIPIVTATPASTSADTGHESSPGSDSIGQTGPNVRWTFNGTEWAANGTAPSCSEPLGLQTPVDMSIVTGALWPGQQRGAYVAHGGFRFDDNVDNQAIVRAPLGSHLVQASQYLSGGTPQYLLFFSVPCGFFYRFDHVLEVPPAMAEALKDIPIGGEGESRTSFINPPLWVDQGDIVGTAVGIPPSNIFVDFGLYDVRQPNYVTPDPAWADLFARDKEFGHYGVCFFDYLPGTDGDTMRSLPTGIEGKTSDFCD